jgi:hypothetical protein
LGTDWKNFNTKIGTGTLNTTAQNLVAAINEVKVTADAASGGTINLDSLTDVVITTPATGHVLRHNGSSFVNVLGTDYFQPLDSDLTAIAALTTTSYGRAFLELANQAATMALLSAASTSAQGIVELATDGETTTGTDTARAITPSNLAASWTARIATSTSLGTSDTLVPSQNAVKVYADALIGAANGMVFKGVIDASTNPNYPAANAGDLYRISVAGKIGGASGPNVEVGDLILCLTDSTSAGTQAGVGSNWNISQVNIDGAVTGPASATSGNLASYNGTTGKVVQDAGFSASNAAIGAGSATILPTSAAVVAYAQPIDSDLTAIAALTTTSYGRGLLTLADAAALTAALSAASETVSGRIEIATQAETDTGTDDVRAVTPLKFQTRLAAYAQPLDSDLTAIAALTTTSYGRGLLTLADAAALTAALSASSETVSGRIEIATQTETNTGTDDVRAVTPLKLASNITTLFGNPDTDLAAAYTTAKA